MKQLLHSLRKRFGIDTDYFIRGGVWLVAGQVATFVLTAATSIAIAHWLPQEVYGNYVYVIAVTSILSIAVLPGMEHAVIRLVAQNKDYALPQSLRTKLRWGIWSAVASVVVGVYHFVIGDTLLAITFFAISLLLPLSKAFTTYRSYLSGKKDFDTQTKYNVIEQISLAASFILMLLFTDNLVYLLLVNFLVQFATSAWFYKKVCSRSNILITKSTPKLKFSYGKHLSIMQILDIVRSHIDKILIWTFLGPSEVAIYSYALLPIVQIQSLLGKTAGTLAFPKLVELHDRDMQSLRKKILLLMLITTPIAIIYILAAPLLFDWFFPQYIESIPLTQLLALQIIGMPFMFLGVTLTARAKQTALYIKSGVTNTVYIAVLAILLPLYGIYGAVIGQLVYQFGNGLLLLVLYNYSFRKKRTL